MRAPSLSRLTFALGLVASLLLSTPVARASRADGRRAGASSFSLVLDPRGIAPSEIAPLQSFVSSVSALLPAAMKELIGREIQVRFSRMSGRMTRLALPACVGGSTTEAANEPADPPGDEATPARNPDQARMELLGHDNYSGRSSFVDLNSLFIQEILAGPNGTRSYPCGHRNMYRLAVATLVHELTHVYDARLGRNASTRNAYFQKLMGFTKQRSWKTLFLIPFLKPKNRFLMRSPDPYEFKNIKETFAVNMEYFVLDPEFGCRRPAVDAYYRGLLGVTSQPGCKLDTKVYLNSDNPSVNLRELVDLDPSRIYDIHYLLASKSSQLMSRWGHAMYRVIVCAPWRKTVGPECLQDVEYHVVLSYRANVSDLMLSYIKGLDGGYPSQLFILPLPEVLTEYNKLELRDLVSLPLNLSDQEKRQFIYRTLEQYWEYQGRYYFFTNNCASESLTLLQGVLPDRKVQKLHDMTPIGLEGDLNKLGLINEGLVKDSNEAIEKGYFFASKQPVLDDAFAAIQARVPDLAVSSTDEYLNKTSAEERQHYFNEATRSLQGNDRVKLAAYFYLMESYISSFDEQSISKKVAGVVEKIGAHPDEAGGAAGNDGIDPGMIRTMESAEPWNRLTSGYGVPQPEDFDNQLEQSQTSELQQIYKKFQEWMQSHFQDDLGEFQKIQLNLAAFAQAITQGVPSLGPASQG